MDSSDHSDTTDSSSTLRDILADLAVADGPDSGGPLASPQPWSFVSHTPRQSTSSTSSRPSPMPRTSSIHRPGNQQRNPSTSHIPTTGPGEPSTTQSPLFNTPSRSIFASGPATASVSVNTAQASMSPALPSTISRPLSVLTGPSLSSRKNSAKDPSAVSLAATAGASRRSRISVPEKDIDDPTHLPPDEPIHPTSAALSKLFVPESASRPTSYLRSSSSAMALPGRQVQGLTTHLLGRGLMDGRYSDITVHAFGTGYKLHRLLLDQVPFFSSAFSGPWAESSSKEMTLYPEEIDSNITKSAFELALKRIYGCALPIEEEQEALNLFATGCWLDMADLVDSSVESLLRQMHTSKLDQLINLVTSNYYGKAGDRILASAKAVLCREGWEMPYHYWDGIPAEIVREIIGGDAFFIPSEWERWCLTARLLNRRLKAKAIEAGLVAPNGRLLHPKPTSIKFFAVRFDAVYRQDSMIGVRQVTGKDDAWVGLYTSPDVAPLLVLLDEGIHYVHLQFEQLQQIRSLKDILGVPVVPDKVISSALWMSMELRQRIVNAQESDQELGLAQVADEHTAEEDERGLPPPDRGTAKGKELEHNEDASDMPSDSWDLNGRARKFWIPSTDSSSLMGGTTEAYAAAALSNVASWTPHMTRLSTSVEPSDAHWATDFMANGIEAPRNGRTHGGDQQPRFSHYPPFRFSAEFPNPRTLKERKRLYSQTVWYAGSMWNLYIQRQNTPKNQQLGIYLHRAKERDTSTDMGSIPLPHLTVDDRIGHLEREMLLRKTQRRPYHWRTTVSSSGGEADPEDETSASGDGEVDPIVPADRSTTQQAATSRSSDSRLPRPAELVNTNKTSDSSTATILDSATPFDHRAADHDYLLTSSDDESEGLHHASNKFSMSAMPTYVDARPTIRTYFKIYSPSKTGRMLSVYESAPDRFNFSQSWGWRSSQMILDDGMSSSGGSGVGKDGKLRYMVVLGLV